MEKSDKRGMSHRNFLKTVAAVGTTLTVQPAIDKMNAANSAIMGKHHRKSMTTTDCHTAYFVGQGSL